MIFVDAGAWIAKHVERDEHHRRAVQAWDQLTLDREPLVTTNLVVAEVGNHLQRRADTRFARERLRRIYSSPDIEVARPTLQQELEALRLMRHYADARIGFTDCVSFVVMQERGVRRVFGFDRHFDIAGFERWPLV